MKLNLNISHDKDSKGNISPILIHKFNPIESDPELVLDVEYLKAGERMNYAKVGRDSRIIMDFISMFGDKVKAIHGLSVSNGDEERDIKTAEEFLALPSSIDLEEIIISVGVHLTQSDTISEIDAKN